MNASKRKFNALINGIGNKSSTSLASKEVNNGPGDHQLGAGEGDSQAKKRRVSDTTSITSASDMPSSGTRRSPVATKLKKTTTMESHAEAPKYAPWDREAFLKRLRSFQRVTDWTPKPDRVDEVQWAKRGWVCQGMERVRCCLCNVEILVKLNRKEVDGKEVPVYVTSKIEDALVDKYVELIVSSHDEGCLWRNRGCDDSIFKLPLNHTGTTFSNLKERYNELIEKSSNLPYLFNLRLPPGFDPGEVLSTLPPNFFAPHSEAADAGAIQPTAINKVAFIMALFGWQEDIDKRTVPQYSSVSCYACFRTLGLWLFKSKKVNEAGEEVVGAAMNCLDVIKQHREYCPWRNPLSQNSAAVKTSTTGMAGWEIILRIIHNDYVLRSQQESPRKPTQPRNSPKTPEQSNATSAPQDEEDDEDAMSIRDEEDKKRFAKLRAFKNLLFETKAGKTIQREKSK